MFPLRAPKGASKIYLYGDSSGGTMVAEVMLWVAHHKLANNSLGVEIAGGATFSAWLDFTASSPTYESVRWCDGMCWGDGDPVEREPPGWAMGRHAVSKRARDQT